MRFPCCECHHGTPCVFTEESLYRLFLRQRNMDFARCPRHGALVTGSIEARDLKEAKQKAKSSNEYQFSE